MASFFYKFPTAFQLFENFEISNFYIGFNIFLRIMIGKGVKPMVLIGLYVPDGDDFFILKFIL